jgi:hypothetical protein
VSFHDFKPGLEQTEPPEPTTHVYDVTVEQTLIWEFTVRAESEAEAIEMAYDAREYRNPHDTKDCTAEAIESRDNGQEVDLE